MAYTNPYSEAAPLGSVAANLIDDLMRSGKIDIRERLESIFGVGIFTTDPVTIAQLKFTAATSKVIPGATSLSLRNSADSADNILISDAGDVTIRNSLVTKGNIGGRTLSIDDSSDVAQFQATISGGGGLQFKPTATATTKHLFLLDSTNNTKVDIDFQTGASIWSGGVTVNAGGAAITGNTSITGSFLVNNGAGAASTEIRGAVANKRSLFYTTGGSVRWEAYANATPESGSNAGSDWQLSNYNDAGTFIGNPISIFRSNGSIWFESSVQSRFRFTGISNGSMVSTLDFYSSPVGTPTVYSRAGGIELQYTAGAISGFGIFADAVDLEIKSTNTANTINLLNKVSLSTTGVAAGTSILDLNKDNGASATLYIKINRAGSTKAYIGLDSGDNLCLLDNTGGTKTLQVSNAGCVTLGTQTNYPSANFTDGSNTLEMGWSGNTFFIKQTQVTDRILSFRNHSSVDILSLDYAGNKVSGNIFDATIGFRIGGAGGGGKYLRGDGTNFVSSSILAGDLPTALTPTTLSVGGGVVLNRIISASTTWNPGTVGSGGQAQTTLAVAGAQVGDFVLIMESYELDNTHGIFRAYVSSAGNVTIQVVNDSASAGVTYTNRTIKFLVIG